MATVQVQRRGSSVSSKVEVPTGFATVYASVTYLEIAPVKAWTKATLLGVAGGKVYKISWEGGEEIRTGDRVVWKGRNYQFTYDQDDQDREGGIVSAYQTGFLTEEGL